MPHQTLLKELHFLIKTFIAIDFTEPVKETIKIDIEVLHQLRVKARSLNSLIDSTSNNHHHIKQLIKQSNSVRDLDVVIFEILPMIEAELTKLLPKLSKLKAELLLMRNHLAMDFQAFLKSYNLESIHSEIHNSHEIHSLKDSTANKTHHQLPLADIKLKQQKILSALRAKNIPNKKLHQLRLKVKALRYQVNHFYKEEKQDLSQLKWLQENLGKFHDLDQTLKILRSCLPISELKTYQKIEAVIQQQQTKLLKKIRKKLLK